uniref:Sema domain-containing protein n=1 Tax=Romanomermis culicivorax TaxID=13658 RepID=A0A915L2J4_ROMCU
MNFRAAIFSTSWLLLLTQVIAQRVTKMFKNPLDSDFYPFQRMVVERRYTGRVYLGAVNRLYQFSADLDKQAVFETGPVDDSPDCASSGVCDFVKKHSTDNYNKAMTLYEKANKLIVCGSVRQGACRLHNVYNVSSLDPPISEAVVANDKDSSSVVFVAPGPPDPPTTEVLNVASTYTDSGPFRDEVPAVATLSLQPENLFKIAHRNINSESQVLMERSKRKLYRIEYVYGFASGNY